MSNNILMNPNEIAGIYRILNADCLDKTILDCNSIDLIITSPPYNLKKKYSGKADDDNMEYHSYIYEFTYKWLVNCFDWLKDTGRICINVPIDLNMNGRNPVTSDIIALARNIGFKYHTTIIWNKNTVNNRFAWGSWKKASAPCIILPVEAIIVLYKKTWRKGGLDKSDITGDEFKNWIMGLWSFGAAKGSYVKHIAPFPPELPKRCIKLFSYVDDVVLDPFLGSGTTMVEAINNNRYAIGIEKEENYFKLAKSRIQDETGAMTRKLFKS